MAALQTLQKAASALSSPFVQAGQAYARAASRRPFLVGVVTTGIKTSAADMFAQTVRPPPPPPTLPSPRGLSSPVAGVAAAYPRRAVPHSHQRSAEFALRSRGRPAALRAAAPQARLPCR